MIFEGVNFTDSVIKKMSRTEFIKTHVEIFWQNRDKTIREKMLGEVFDLINPAKKTKKETEN